MGFEEEVTLCPRLWDTRVGLGVTVLGLPTNPQKLRLWLSDLDCSQGSDTWTCFVPSRFL